MRRIKIVEKSTGDIIYIDVDNIAYASLTNKDDGTRALLVRTSLNNDGGWSITNDRIIDKLLKILDESSEEVNAV